MTSGDREINSLKFINTLLEKCHCQGGVPVLAFCLFTVTTWVSRLVFLGCPSYVCILRHRWGCRFVSKLSAAEIKGTDRNGSDSIPWGSTLRVKSLKKLIILRIVITVITAFIIITQAFSLAISLHWASPCSPGPHTPRATFTQHVPSLWLIRVYIISLVRCASVHITFGMCT